MTIEQFKKAHEARPFTPLEIHLADGRSFRVDHPEFLARSPSGRTIVVADTDETHEIIDLLLVTSLDMAPRRNGRRR